MKEDYDGKERFYHSGKQKLLEQGTDFARFDLAVEGFDGKNNE
jgi:hypothetical protein